MKKIITITIIALLANIILMTFSAFAAVGSECNPPCGPGEACQQVGDKNVCVEMIESLLPRPGEHGEDIRELYPETGTIGDLPEVGTAEVFAETIKTILGWSMLITIIAIVVAAIYYLTSQGSEEDIAKAKNIIIYMLIGIAIMAAAYGIISGVAQFKFFKAAP